MFFCEFSEMFKNTYSEEHLRTVASKIQKFTKKIGIKPLLPN